MTTPITPSEPKCAKCRHRFETRSLTHACTAPGCWCYHGPTVIVPDRPHECVDPEEPITPSEPRCAYPDCGKPPKHRYHKPCNDPFSQWCRSSTCHPFTPAEPPAKCEGCWHPPVDHWQGVYECTRPGCQCPSLVTAEPQVDRSGEQSARERYEGFGRAVMEWARDPSFFDMEVSEELCEIAQKFGLVELVAYDPDKHGEIDDVEPGDMVWHWTEEKRDD